MTKHQQYKPTYTKAERKAEREIDNYLGSVAPASTVSILQQLQSMS